MGEVETQKAIRKAIKQGNLPEVRQLIDDDESRLQLMTPFGTWLHVAAAHGKLDIARWLVSKGADVNAEGGSMEGTPLHIAATNGHLNIVKILLESGAIVDTSRATRNPLIGAILGGISDSHTAIAKLLIHSGIDTSIRYTSENMTNMDAVAFAREWGRSDIVELLEADRRE